MRDRPSLHFKKNKNRVTVISRFSILRADTNRPFQFSSVSHNNSINICSNKAELRGIYWFGIGKDGRDRLRSLQTVGPREPDINKHLRADSDRPPPTWKTKKKRTGFLGRRSYRNPSTFQLLPGLVASHNLLQKVTTSLWLITVLVLLRTTDPS